MHRTPSSHMFWFIDWILSTFGFSAQKEASFKWCGIFKIFGACLKLASPAGSASWHSLPHWEFFPYILLHSCQIFRNLMGKMWNFNVLTCMPLSKSNVRIYYGAEVFLSDVLTLGFWEFLNSPHENFVYDNC